jgi:hypothetical protein
MAGPVAWVTLTVAKAETAPLRVDWIVTELARHLRIPPAAVDGAAARLLGTGQHTWEDAGGGGRGGRGLCASCMFAQCSRHFEPL